MVSLFCTARAIKGGRPYDRKFGKLDALVEALRHVLKTLPIKKASQPGLMAETLWRFDRLFWRFWLAEQRRRFDF